MNDLMLSLYVQQGGIKLSAGAVSVTRESIRYAYYDSNAVINARGTAGQLIYELTIAAV